MTLNIFSRVNNIRYDITEYDWYQTELHIYLTNLPNKHLDFLSQSLINTPNNNAELNPWNSILLTLEINHYVDYIQLNLKLSRNYMFYWREIITALRIVRIYIFHFDIWHWNLLIHTQITITKYYALLCSILDISYLWYSKCDKNYSGCFSAYIPVSSTLQIFLKYTQQRSLKMTKRKFIHSVSKF